MLKMTAGQKKMIAWFVVAVAIAALHTSAVLPNLLHLHDIHTLVYASIVIAWGFLVHQRINNRLARQHLVAASVFMFILFLSRLVRWICFGDSPVVMEYAWYAYYVSFTGVTLCCFLAALCVGKSEKDRPLHVAKWLWLLQIGLSVLALTNSFHELFFHFRDETHEKYDYGILLYLCLALGAVFAIATMATIIRRCQIAALRKYAFIPSVGMFFFAGLIAWYYIIGGSPKLFGHSLYNLQEVFCLMFIFPFESMIQLGIMPGNSRYALFFEQSPISARIEDNAGEIVYESKAHAAIAQNLAEKSENERRNEKTVHGGKIIWFEDLTAIRQLDEEIQKVTEQLEEENDLIRQENEIRAERISYETKNRLYDKIAGAVREKALAIDGILTQLVQNGGVNSKEQLTRAMILGAYVKRMGNMMLIMEESEKISSKELGNAVRESLEYFGLTGLLTDFQELGERRLPAKAILLAYDLLETLLESEFGMDSLVIFLDARKGFTFRILLDAERLPLDASWRAEELAMHGLTLSVDFVDDTWRVILTAGEEGES
ncbi:MAG: hypothetical protein II139_01395 [Lachnospiraceae bacterium]|nr:hypothetical protein [Lachnospiraceae bacterium]